MNYTERFIEIKNDLRNLHSISKLFRSGVRKLINNDLKQLQREIKTNGCGLNYSDHKEMNIKICSKIEGLCPTCQNLINQIEKIEILREILEIEKEIILLKKLK